MFIKISSILASLKKSFESFRGGATDQKFEGGEALKIERGVRVPHGVIARGVHHPLPPLHISVIVQSTLTHCAKFQLPTSQNQRPRLSELDEKRKQL